jgi:hypothetical protein
MDKKNYTGLVTSLKKIVKYFEFQSYMGSSMPASELPTYKEYHDAERHNRTTSHENVEPVQSIFGDNEKLDPKNVNQFFSSKIHLSK